MATLRTPIESGVPDNKQYLHPLMVKNYGNWKYHDRPRPGAVSYTHLDVYKRQHHGCYRILLQPRKQHAQ